MLSEGMKDQAYRTAWGLYHTSYETKGYWFRMPEAWDITGNYRASMYMRPAAIWAMEMTQPPKRSVPVSGSVLGNPRIEKNGGAAESVAGLRAK
jgi:hypothetical protein